jgi:hypothetical protein
MDFPFKRKKKEKKTNKQKKKTPKKTKGELAILHKVSL